MTRTCIRYIGPYRPKHKDFPITLQSTVFIQFSNNKSNDKSINYATQREEKKKMIIIIISRNIVEIKFILCTQLRFNNHYKRSPIDLFSWRVIIH